MTTQENKPVDKKKVLEALWRRGQLSWLLDANQLELYNLFHTSNFKIQTWLLARRSGKSYTLCVMAIEQCLRHPKSIGQLIYLNKSLH